MDCESFDSYTSPASTTTGVASRWTRSVTGANEATLEAGRFGGQALQLGVEGATNPRVICYRLLLTDTPDAEFRFSVAFKRDSGAHNPSFMGLSLGRSGDRHLGFRFLLDRSIQIGTGNQTADSEGMAAVIATTDTEIYNLNQWHTLNGRGLIHPSAGWVEIMIDGDVNRTFMFSGLDTEGVAGQPTITHASFSANGNGPGSTALESKCAFDDFVIELNSNAEHLPECRIQPLAVTGDGAHLDLVPSTGVDHYAVVDEAIVSTTDYLQGTLNGEYDLLTCADLSVVPGSILGVQTVGWAAKTDVATRSWHLGLESGGTVDDGVAQALTTSAAPIHRFFATDPDTGVAWDQAGVNAAQLKPTVVV